MGQEAETGARHDIFAPYRVNSALMSLAAPNAIFMHCLPAHRGAEVTDEVIDSRASVVFDQAENRLHTQKALLAMLARSAVIPSHSHASGGHPALRPAGGLRGSRGAGSRSVGR
jgi:ornithine carbamoyltransferase